MRRVKLDHILTSLLVAILVMAGVEALAVSALAAWAALQLLPRRWVWRAFRHD